MFVLFVTAASLFLSSCLGNSGDIYSATEPNDMTKSKTLLCRKSLYYSELFVSAIQTTDECSPIIKTSNSVLPILRSTGEKSSFDKENELNHIKLSSFNSNKRITGSRHLIIKFGCSHRFSV